MDDEPQTLRYIRDALSDTGYSVIVTADPEEALDLMVQESPDLALGRAESYRLIFPGQPELDRTVPSAGV